MLMGSRKKAVGPVDPFFSDVSLLVNADNQANGSTTILDRSSVQQSLTNFSNSVSVSTSIFKFGTGSLNFSGSHTGVGTDTNAVNNVGTGDFTLEAWIYPTSVASNWGAIHTLGPIRDDGFYIFKDSLRFYRLGITLEITNALSVNTWFHVAATRSGTTLRIFLNGVSSSTANLTYNFNSNTGRIGANLSGGEQFPGYIDDLRLTKRVARYTYNFTPPTAAFPTQ
jgi:hypothetical protein